MKVLFFMPKHFFKFWHDIFIKIAGNKELGAIDINGSKFPCMIHSKDSFYFDHSILVMTCNAPL